MEQDYTDIIRGTKQNKKVLHPYVLVQYKSISIENY